MSDGSGVGSGQGELDAVVLPENWWMALDGGVGVAVVVIVVKSCARVAPSPAGDVEGAPPSATIRSADGSTGQGETTTSTLRLANTPLPYPATGPR